MTAPQSRLLPPGFALAGGVAATAALAGRPGAGLLVLVLSWLAASVAVLRPAPRSPATRLLAAALLAGAAALLLPALSTAAAWLLLSLLTATFALREGLEGSAAEGWKVLIDALILGSSIGAIVQVLGGLTLGTSPGAWIAGAATAVAAPWVSGCTRGTGATRATLLAFAATLSLVAAVTALSVLPRALWSAAGLSLVVAMAGRGALLSPLLMGSPAQQRRCRRARLGTTLVLPLVAVAVTVVAALRDPVLPGVLVITLAVLAGAAVLRGRLVSGVASPPCRGEGGGESAERLAALSEYARLVAHEVRNSLSVLFSTTDLLRRDRDEAQRHELLDVLGEEGDRVRDVIDQLTTFAGEEGASSGSLVRLREIARAAAQRALERTGWPEGVTIGLDLAGGDDVVVADAQRLEIAVSHVMLAAAQGGGRRVSVGTGREGRRRLLRVEGDGPSSLDLPAPTPSRLLSAATDDGAALGLAVAQRTLSEHGGRLRFSRSDRGGFVAVVELPAEGA